MALPVLSALAHWPLGRANSAQVERQVERIYFFACQTLSVEIATR